MNKRQKKKFTKKTNKKLVEKYPFLRPYSSDKEYNYEYTRLDEMPKGWRKCFGLLFCEMIRKELIKENIKDYKIFEIKEKYGSLCISDINSTEEIREIISKFTYISKHTCIFCGKLDAAMTNFGWTMPLCRNCCFYINPQISEAEIDEIFNNKEKLHLFFPEKRIKNGKEKEFMVHVKDIINELDCKENRKYIDFKHYNNKKKSF